MHLVSLLPLIALQTVFVSAKKEKAGKHHKCPISDNFSSSDSYSSSCQTSSSSIPKYNSKCVATLRNAIRVPDSCAYRYLSSVSNVLKAQAPLLFTSSIGTVIANFESTYRNILVTVVDALGNSNLYLKDQTVVAVQPPQYSNTAKNYINIDGFVRAPESNQNFFYSFVVWNAQGQMLEITLTMPILDDPIFC